MLDTVFVAFGCQPVVACTAMLLELSSASAVLVAAGRVASTTVRDSSTASSLFFFISLVLPICI